MADAAAFACRAAAPPPHTHPLPHPTRCGQANGPTTKAPPYGQRDRCATTRSHLLNSAHFRHAVSPPHLITTHLCICFVAFIGRRAPWSFPLQAPSPFLLLISSPPSTFFARHCHRPGGVLARRRFPSTGATLLAIYLSLIWRFAVPSFQLPRQRPATNRLQRLISSANYGSPILCCSAVSYRLLLPSPPLFLFFSLGWYLHTVCWAWTHLLLCHALPAFTSLSFCLHLFLLATSTFHCRHFAVTAPVIWCVHRCV